jgi:hypothetical protein
MRGKAPISSVGGKTKGERASAEPYNPQPFVINNPGAMSNGEPGGVRKRACAEPEWVVIIASGFARTCDGMSPRVYYIIIGTGNTWLPVVGGLESDVGTGVCVGVFGGMGATKCTHWGPHKLPWIYILPLFGFFPPKIEATQEQELAGFDPIPICRELNNSMIDIGNRWTEPPKRRMEGGRGIPAV